MRSRLPVLLLCLAAGACTRFRAANELAEQGKFVEAAELFERLHQEKPDDPEIAEHLERARRRAVEQALGQSRRARLEGHSDEAFHTYAKGLELRDRWSVKLDGALESTVDEAHEDLVAQLRQQAAPFASAGEGLALQALTHRHDFVLRFPEQKGLRDELTAQTQATGRARCEALRKNAGADRPYWSLLVARYCAHFNVDGPRQWPLPELLNAATTSAAVSGLAEGHAGALEGALRTVFDASPWYSDKGTAAGALAIAGQAAQRTTERPVTLSAEWTEKVPYTVNVTKTLEEEVPVTECETYETRSATGQTLVQSREVQRTKKKTREVVVAETRFRDVPRVFEYQALRVERAASYSVRATLSAQGQTIASAGRDEQDTQSAYLHDVRFEPAGVVPQRPGFGPAEHWYRGRTDELIANFTTALSDAYRARFCTSGSLALEEAARCVRVKRQVPTAAVLSLKAELGEDARFASDLF
ncbi:MAG: hypothetical protein K1X89_04950 [Myxococcaceae bacterium]|nr:hypothetical protein [Myxococcaceae bacterium]